MTVTLTRTGAVAEVTLNRPEKMNAVDGSIFEGLFAAGEEIRADRSIRAVVLTGAGGNFSAGVDLQFMQGSLSIDGFKSNALDLPQGQIANYYQRPSIIWQDVEVPVICALEGVAFGAGCQIALGADIRIAAPAARMCVMEMKWGLIPDMGLLATLPRLVRMDQAMDLVLSARIVAAAEAAELGLVTRLSETPLADAREMAEQIANRSPDAVRASKQLLNRGWDMPKDAALRLEADLQASILGQPNQIEAVMANLQKRPPQFKD